MGYKSTLKPIGIHAVLAIMGLLMALIVGWWIVLKQDVLGLQFERAYYVLLVILGISVALVLFGVLRSTAAVRGKHLGVNAELGGPAALFAVVVMAGFWLTKPTSSFDIAIHLRFQGAPNDQATYEAALVRTKLRVAYGMDTREYPVDAFGVAHILDIPGRFRDGTFTVDIAPGPIRLVDHDPEKAVRFPARDEPLVIRATLDHQSNSIAAENAAQEKNEPTASGAPSLATVTSPETRDTMGNYAQQPAAVLQRQQAGVFLDVTDPSLRNELTLALARHGLAAASAPESATATLKASYDVTRRFSGGYQLHVWAILSVPGTKQTTSWENRPELMPMLDKDPDTINRVMRGAIGSSSFESDLLAKLPKVADQPQ